MRGGEGPKKKRIHPITTNVILPSTSTAPSESRGRKEVRQRRDTSLLCGEGKATKVGPDHAPALATDRPRWGMLRWDFNAGSEGEGGREGRGDLK
jgi:hypothetical protein